MNAANFRLEVRQWLEGNCPESQRLPFKSTDLVWPGRNQTFPDEDARLWFERMRERGWTCPEFPAQYGGGGLDKQQGKILAEEMRKLKCRPPLTDQGISMLGPALLEFGTEAQKCEHIPKIVQGEIRWCQGYSEPGAGSDLAGLQCKADLIADHFIVNGSKIWTSFGLESDWIFCLVRTRKTEKKQQGISFLLIDMAAEGVTAKPIELISGESDFAQIFFDNVKVPVANVVGGVDNGWVVTKALLKYERRMMANLGSDVFGGNMPVTQCVKQYAKINEDGSIADPMLRNAVSQHEMMMRAIGLAEYRIHQQTLAKQLDMRLPLIMKYVGTRQVQVKDELLADIMGINALGWEEASFNEREHRVSKELLFNKALTIAGGTSEIQLNIIAKNALGLPQGGSR